MPSQLLPGEVAELPRRRRAYVALFDLFCLVLVAGGGLGAAALIFGGFPHV